MSWIGGECGSTLSPAMANVLRRTAMAAGLLKVVLLLLLGQVVIADKTSEPPFHFVTQTDLSAELSGAANTYLPEMLEVRGGTRNTALHGLYKRDPELQSQEAAALSHRLMRPVYKKIGSSEDRPEYYMLWIDAPEQMWVISTESTVPASPPAGMLLAKMTSRAASPAYSRGWRVRGRKGASGLGLNEQLPSAEFKLPSFSALERSKTIAFLQTDGDLSGATGTGVMTWKVDPDFIVDEARAGTYSLLVNGETEKGCPNPTSSEAFGFAGYHGVDPCLPPSEEHVKGTHHLDFVLRGVGKYLNETLFTWDGFYLRRPIFALRSAINPTPANGFSAIDGRVQYMWAEGVENAPPIWRISRQVGNSHPSQVFASWMPKLNNKGSYVPADWPAETALELAPNSWQVAPVGLHMRQDEQSAASGQGPTIIQTRGVEDQFADITVSGSPVRELGGVFHLMGDYFGYPYFRQGMTPAGKALVMYRGRVVAGDIDAWVIGARLGSKEGIRAYVQAPSARWPHLAKEGWRYWEPSAQTWTGAPAMRADVAFVEYQERVKSMLGRCPLPACAPGQSAHCPSEGSCMDCMCRESDTAPPQQIPSQMEQMLGPALSASEVLRKMDADDDGTAERLPLEGARNEL